MRCSSLNDKPMLAKLKAAAPARRRGRMAQNKCLSAWSEQNWPDRNTLQHDCLPLSSHIHGVFIIEWHTYSGKKEGAGAGPTAASASHVEFSRSNKTTRSKRTKVAYNPLTMITKIVLSSQSLFTLMFLIKKNLKCDRLLLPSRDVVKLLLIGVKIKKWGSLQIFEMDGFVRRSSLGRKSW
jgi:hypothetical protein